MFILHVNILSTDYKRTLSCFYVVPMSTCSFPKLTQVSAVCSKLYQLKYSDAIYFTVLTEKGQADVKLWMG